MPGRNAVFKDMDKDIGSPISRIQGQERGFYPCGRHGGICIHSRGRSHRLVYPGLQYLPNPLAQTAAELIHTGKNRQAELEAIDAIA